MRPLSLARNYLHLSQTIRKGKKSRFVRTTLFLKMAVLLISSLAAKQRPER
jgi:hypothetical protein